jgi:hypothetical protein
MYKQAMILLAVLMLVSVIPVSAYAPSLSQWLGDETCVIQDGYEFCITVKYDIDCDGWEYKGFIPRWTYPKGGAIGIYAGYVSHGFWTIDGVLETYTWVGTFYFNLGEVPDVYHVQFPVTDVLHEPDCSPDSCAVRKQYFMYTLRDYSQPPTWQTYCYIISNNGVPSVESQARICSVPGFDHVYRAAAILYADWVYTDCNGNPSYGWPDWQPEWYRKEYTK